jgi:alpha-beta hydrolase superfamily lysophospholipase
MTSVRFGSPAISRTLAEKLDDATSGNKDGIVGNERAAAGSTAGTSIFDTNPLLFGARALVRGLLAPDDRARVQSFVTKFSEQHGPITTLARPAYVSEAAWNTFVADKAITLQRLGEAPSAVKEAIVRASGSVNGEAIAPRDIFTQTWAPDGTPSGKTIVISPGFLETGRDYVEQIQLLRKLGHEVVVMDQQWAGLTSGDKGGIDRGFGITRDVAAVTAAAAQGGNEVILVGTSMGAGAGALGAALMNDNGRVQLDGPQMPRGVNVVLQAPFFERTQSLPNAALALAGSVPLLRDVPLPATGLPILSQDQATLRKIAAGATTEELSGRAQAFHASTADLATMRTMLQKGLRPLSKIAVIHAKDDTLAKYDATKEWVSLLGPRATLRTVDSTSHVFEQNPAEQGLLLEALESFR